MLFSHSLSPATVYPEVGAAAWWWKKRLKQSCQPIGSKESRYTHDPDGLGKYQAYCFFNFLEKHTVVSETNGETRRRSETWKFAQQKRFQPTLNIHEHKAWRTVHISAARGTVLPPGVPIKHVSLCGNVSFSLASSKTWGKKYGDILDYMSSSLNYTKRLPPGRAGPLRDLRRKGNTSSS